MQNKPFLFYYVYFNYENIYFKANNKALLMNFRVVVA